MSQAWPPQQRVHVCPPLSLPLAPEHKADRENHKRHATPEHKANQSTAKAKKKNGYALKYAAPELKLDRGCDSPLASQCTAVRTLTPDTAQKIVPDKTNSTDTSEDSGIGGNNHDARSINLGFSFTPGATDASSVAGQSIFSPPQAKVDVQRVEYCCSETPTLGERSDATLLVRSSIGGKRQGFTPEAPEVWVQREDAARFHPGLAAGRSPASTGSISRNRWKKMRQRANKRKEAGEFAQLLGKGDIIQSIGEVGNHWKSGEVGNPSILGQVAITSKSADGGQVATNRLKPATGASIGKASGSAGAGNLPVQA